MKTILSALLAAAFCTAMACPAMAEDAAAPAVTAEKIAELVKQLGSDDFKARALHEGYLLIYRISRRGGD